MTGSPPRPTGTLRSRLPGLLRRRRPRRRTSRRSRARLVPAAGLGGVELVHLGGGEMVPTPDAARLPLTARQRARGVGAGSVALPPASVRILTGARVAVGTGVVVTASGQVVAESVPAGRADQLDGRFTSRAPLRLVGTIAPYGTPSGAAAEGLLEALPRALLCRHPALARVAPIQLLHDGRRPPIEQLFLSRVADERVEVVRCDAAVATADRVLMPSAVCRADTGALPRWYRRWIDRTAAEIAAAAPLPTSSTGDGAAMAAPRLLLVHGDDDPALRERRLVRLAEHGITVLDTANATLWPAAAGLGSSPEAAVAALWSAEVVIGTSDDALAHAALARHARVVQVGTGAPVSPRVLQLCASRGLPHHFCAAEELEDVLADLGDD